MEICWKELISANVSGLTEYARITIFPNEHEARNKRHVIVKYIRPPRYLHCTDCALLAPRLSDHGSKFHHRTSKSVLSATSSGRVSQKSGLTPDCLAIRPAILPCPNRTESVSRYRCNDVIQTWRHRSRTHWPSSRGRRRPGYPVEWRSRA